MNGTGAREFQDLTLPRGPLRAPDTLSENNYQYPRKVSVCFWMCKQFLWFVGFWKLGYDPLIEYSN